MNLCKNFLFIFLPIFHFLWSVACLASTEIVKHEPSIKQEIQGFEPFQYCPIELNKAIFSSFLNQDTCLRSFLDLRTINKKSDKYVDIILAEYTTLKGILTRNQNSGSYFYKDLWKLAVNINYVTNIEKILNGDVIQETIQLLYKLVTNQDCCVNKLFGLQAYDFFDNIDSVNDQDIIQSISSEITYITDENKVANECPVSLACIDGNNDKAVVLGSVRNFVLNSISMHKTPKIILFQPKNDTLYLQNIREMSPYSFIVKQKALKKPDSILICEVKQPHDYVENNGDIKSTKKDSTKRDQFDGSYIDYSYVFLYQDRSNKNATLLNLLLFPSWCLQKSKIKWFSFYNNCFKWLTKLYSKDKEKIFCKMFFPHEKSFLGKGLFKESLNLFCQPNKNFETSLFSLMQNYRAV